mmetsp:Transcript_25757/g.60146  ORF Transcript_25757/g.60146 Transcript_25757/m.60146 type:complete len:375 (+) Transcript_25757:84-1208(+)
MMLTPVTPVEPLSLMDAEGSVAEESTLADVSTEQRVNLTTPPDKDNELIKVAAQSREAGGSIAGVLAVQRKLIDEQKDYAWFVVLGLRAIEVALSPRHEGSLRILRSCDPVEKAMEMLEMELIDEVFMLMRRADKVREAQRSGLAIIELLTMDDTAWRDEVARKGGVKLICNIAKRWCDHQQVMCQVMTCMSYLAAEDYIEVMLCQHDALQHVTYVLKNHSENTELVTRACLALLNLTVCESHVEELLERDAIGLALQVLDNHAEDIHVVIIVCGILANMSVIPEARQVLVDDGLFPRIASVMRMDPFNAVLQVAALKAIVNYATKKNYYDLMEREDTGIVTLVGRMMVDHPWDQGVQKYGNLFLGRHQSCWMS